MAGAVTLELRFDDAVEAVAAYAGGLRNGVARVDGAPAGLTVGQRVDLDIELSYARFEARLHGEVAELANGRAVVFLDLVPAELVRLLAPALADGDDTEPLALGEVVYDGGHPDSADELSEPSGEVTEETLSEGALDGLPSRGGAAVPPSPDDEASADSLGDPVGLDADDLVERSSASLDGTVDPSRSGDRLAAADRGESLTLLAPPDEGVPLPDVEGRTLPSIVRFKGRLGDGGWAPVLWAILRDRLTGVLVVDGPSTRVWVYCRAGLPVHVVRRPAPSPNPFELLATERRLLEPDVARRCRYLAQVTGRPYMSVVMRLGLLDEGVVQQLRREVTSRQLGQVLTHLRGPFRFFTLAEVDVLFAHTPASVVETLVRWALEQRAELTTARAHELLLEHARHHVYLTALGDEVRPQLGLDASNARVLGLLLAPDHTLLQAADAEGDEWRVMRLATALCDLGLAELSTLPAGAARQREVAERALRELYGRLEQDLFGFIGGHWSDPPATLERRLARSLEVLDACPPRMTETEDLDLMRERIGDTLAQARRTLFHDGRRKAYRDGRVGVQERRLASAQLALEAALARALGRQHEARTRLEMVLELDPGGPGSDARTARIRRMLAEIG